MAAIEKAINDFFNSGSLKAAAYRANAIFGFSSKVIFREGMNDVIIGVSIHVCRNRIGKISLNNRHPLQYQFRLNSTFPGSLCPCLCLLDVNSFLAGFKLLDLPSDTNSPFQPMAVPTIDTSRVSVVRGEGSCLTGSK